MFPAQKLYQSQVIEIEEVISLLLHFGYRRQAAITREGEFACRGGIVDIWPLTFELPLRIEWDQEQIKSLQSIDLPSGRSFWEHTVAIILPLRPGGPKLPRPGFKEDFPLANFLDIKFGDLIVHNRYGIGKFCGFESIRATDKPQKHLVIEYAGSEKLFVPVESMHLVQKYSAFGRRRPSLTRLGTKDWQRTKQRIKSGIQQFAWQLLSIEAMRKVQSKTAFPRQTPWKRELEADFPFIETPGQKRAWQETEKDMESTRIMDRLLCGDVGYGKTEVAMRAAFKCVVHNKQSAILVPTTILAEQHYLNFKKRLEKFPLRVEMLSRLVSKRRQQEIIADLGNGRVDIIIGTHRLLAADIKFRELGLVVIDEEQRFGVRSKEVLKRLSAGCDVLTLSATPIPRTLYMSLMQLRDISVIDTPVENRLPIKTFVLEYDVDLIRQAILNETQRRGQVYFVHNRVEDIEKVRARLIRILPQELNLGLIHGQMPAAQIESALRDFLNGRINVLISTAIIESGLDIPNANTLIVDNAENFGLAQLHQLRGRVGRFKRAAFAYFLLAFKSAVSSDAKKRLAALIEHSELGAGFKIALQDLEIRGAGNLLGTQQHGFVAAVGFDLYCRLLRETVEGLRKIVQK